MKLHTQTPANVLVNMCAVTAKLAGKSVTIVVDTEEERKAPAYKAFNPTNKFPVLETPEGNLQESHAIGKFLAHGHATLLGSNAVERAQIDQWMNWLQSGLLQSMMPAIYAILGHNKEVTQPMFNESVAAIKAGLRAVDSSLTGDWLVGSTVTLADIYLAGTFSMAFQMILDQGFTKAASKACAWFGRVSALPEFVAVFGKIKMAKKSMKPVIAVDKVAVAKKAAAAAPVEKKEKAPGNPLDALPATPFVIYDFKTLFVNHKDKAGTGHDVMMEMVDHAGWSFWYLHYEKVGTEGKVGYMFQNMLEGFIQRLEGFKKYSFGKFCMLGEEGCYDIKGVLLIRGQTVDVDELKDHPQFEYMQARKMDIADAGDKQKIREYFSSVEDGQCDGQRAAMAVWHK